MERPRHGDVVPRAFDLHQQQVPHRRSVGASMAAAVAAVARDPPNKYANTNPTTAAIRFPRIASPLPNPPRDDPPGGLTEAEQEWPGDHSSQ